MTNFEENELAEKIATLLDKYLDTTIDDMTHINELIQKEKEEAKFYGLGGTRNHREKST